MNRSVLSCLILSLFSAAVNGADHPPMASAPFDADQARQFQKQWAQHVGKDEVYTNTVGMKLSLIPPGEFTMGRTLEQYDKLLEAGKKAGMDPNRLPSWEMLMMPAHRVRITKPFYMGTTEVTVAQFRQFCDESGYKTEAERGLNGGKPYKGRRPICTWRKPMVWIKLQQQDDEPVLHLCWNDCVEFCKWLSKKEGVKYCLPTEAEWEYACRAGTATAWSFGNFEDFDRLGHEYMFVSDGQQGKHDRPSRVAQRKPNAFGLYDMHGNVWEYVADWWHEFYFKESPLNDPPGPGFMNEMRDGRTMIRGGSFDWADSGARSAIRMRIRKDSNQHPHMGFRVALKIDGARGIPAATDELPAVRKDSDPAKVKPFDAAAAQKALAEHCDKEMKIDLGGDTTMTFVAIPKGTFLMGSAEGLRDERPLHKVTLSTPFYMGKYEVTQAQWEALMGEDPRLAKARKNPRQAHNVGPNKPMYGLSWTDCQKFIAALKKKRPNLHFRLPTEAQWEHVCRAGSRTEYHFGNDAARLADSALVCADDAPPLRERDPLDTTVGKRQPNALGIHDLHGSMWEWCQDFYGGDYYAAAPVNDPQGPNNGLLRVLRGGSWFRYGRYARSAYRHSAHPDAVSSDFGFRVVINAGPPPRRNAQAVEKTKRNTGAVASPQQPQPAKNLANVDYTKLARSLVRHGDQPVIKVGSKGTWNDQTLGCFTVLDAGDQFYFYSGGAQFGQPKNIGMATSRDGVHWNYSDQNPLFPGSMPYAIKVGDTFRLYHPGKDESGRRGLVMRTSKDGLTRSESELVFTGGVLDPCVVRVADDRYHLYYCGGGMKNNNGKQVWKFKTQMAISADGINWKKEPQPVVPLGPEGAWDSGSHAGPCVLKLPDGFHMWYLGSGPMGGRIAWRIGHATSPDGIHWTKSGDTPVLDVGKPGAWDGGTFMSFDIVFRDGRLLFWYAAAPGDHGDETKMTIQIGHGTSQIAVANR